MQDWSAYLADRRAGTENVIRTRDRAKSRFPGVSWGFRVTYGP
jgi:hypothetical protein